MSVARPATVRRCHRSPIQRDTTRSVTRNQNPAAPALASAARMLIFAANETGMGSVANAFPSSMKNGLPGGWGSPRTFTAAMYSPVSHIATEGASVIRYRTNTRVPAIAAGIYEGWYSPPEETETGGAMFLRGCDSVVAISGLRADVREF